MKEWGRKAREPQFKLGEVTLSPYMTLNYPYTLHLFHCLSVLGLNAIILLVGSHWGINSILKLNITPDFCFHSSNSYQVNSKGSSLLWWPLGYFLQREIYCKWSLYSSVTKVDRSMISENEDVREVCLTSECTRLMCLRQTLLACKLKIFCLMFNLCSTGRTDCPFWSASEDNAGAGCGLGNCSGSTSTSNSLPDLVTCFCQHILHLLYSPCMCETDPNHPKGTEFMAHDNDQASCTHVTF